MGERQHTEPEEAVKIKSLRSIIAAYANYQDAAERDVERYERSFKMLPPAHKEILFHLGLKYQRLRWCISMNAAFIMKMLEAFEPPFDMSQYVDDCGRGYPVNMHEHSHTDCTHLSEKGDCSSISTAKSNSLLHEQHDCPKEDAKIHESSRETEIKKGEEEHMVGCSQPVVNNMGMSQVIGVSCNSDKDATTAACCNATALHTFIVHVEYSSSSRFGKMHPKKYCTRLGSGGKGKKERDECYKPILEELNRLFPNRSKQRPPSCLVPGAGLGRLALEISSLGFESQGNESSYYMLICSSFILNQTHEANEWTIYPWIHNNCNSLSDNDQLRPVKFPDIHPSSVTEGFSMCAGDFVDIYSEESQKCAWDAVVACFFIDTGHNIVEYIEIISKLLKDGGVWINLCPLLYHFADSYGPDDDMSIEISLEDVKKVAYHYGFVMEMENMIETTYSANTRAMMQNQYRAAFWTMRKNASRSKAQI
ncbi:hypothetical protein EJB05_47377 [Eragrostis curvula]|uniref:carnosine N-methyltransferase n=1 Tax=Eragrostis curvula TaxID=38414 RepID=A0A5J9T7V6_9POAL|nr:hypothetical protein EJB05_47377 [Eragrostis curvula]